MLIIHGNILTRGESPAVLVVVPVLRRPRRAAPLAASLAASVEQVELGLLFVCSPEDDEQIEACDALRRPENAPEGLVSIGYAVIDWQVGPGDWARKINFAYRLSLEPWVFTGADDLCFHPGWADRALEIAEQTGAGVIGTNDLGNPRVTSGKHSTHSLVARAYADERGTVDGPGAVVSEVYAHNFVDDELVATARARGAYAFAADSRVEHLHPNWRKSRTDDVYAIGEATFHEDRIRFARRRRLWLGGRR